MSGPGRVWAPPGRPPGPLLGGFSLSEDARGGAVVRLEVPTPVYAWVQFAAFSWRIDTAVVVAATADAVLVEWVWVGQRQEARVWRAAVKHRAPAPAGAGVPSSSTPVDGVGGVSVR